ncbi:MAG: aminoacyl-tRNA hydrolase [Acidimicrobiales bacterium]
MGRRSAGEGRRGAPADLLVVGLGNPGAEFVGTRHNVGADAVAELSRRHGSGRLRPVKGQRSIVEEVRIGAKRVVLAVPTTYMNESGNAVGPLVRRYGIEDPERIVIVHDELDLPPGGFQVKLGGGLAGHNGLRSVQAHLHTDGFARIRIGIGKPNGDGAGHVLRRPSKADRGLLDETTASAADAVEVIATDGVATAMNRFNARAES